MSPRDSPAANSNFVPLPAELPKMDDRSKKSSKDNKSKEKPKVYVKAHKQSYSADTGYASGYSSPRLEDRSPDQYALKPKTPKLASADITRYETIDGKPRKVTYITKDGKTVKYISRTPVTAIDDEYVPSTALTFPAQDPYKTKYKLTKKAHDELQKAFEDVNETARYNYDAAVQEEAARIATAQQTALQIEKLEKQLRDLTVEQTVLKSQALESDRKRLEAEQRYAKRELEVELSARRQELKEREDREAKLAQRQWAEIQAAESPLSPRFKRQSTLPPLVTQEDRKVTFRRPTDVVKSGYGSSTPATATAKPTPTLAPSNVFMDPIYEAQRDYDKKAQGLDGEDRQRASDVKYGISTARKSPRARRESTAFYK